MPLASSFDPRAREELEEAAAWYGRRSFDLRRRFVEAIESAVSFVERFPESGRAVRGANRSLLVRGFPFGLIYTVRSGEIRILALAHLSRRPYYWNDRGSR